MHIPDLNQEDGVVTIEHCSVLQERLGQVLEDAYPGQSLDEIINTRINPDTMREEILEMFTPEAFLTMFQTELGKGVIIGAFVQRYILDVEEEV